MPTLGEILVKALTPPQSSPKQPLLRNTYTPFGSHSKLWTPTEADFSSPRRELEELYTQGRDFENSLYALGRDLEKSLSSPQDRELFLPTRNIGGALPDLRAPQPPAKSLTLTEQAALFGKAIQSIPEAGARFGAALRNGIENLKVLGGMIVKGLEWLERYSRPRDPYGHPVPRWNVQLYLLAHRAYLGDWKARARFLNEIEADDAPDNVLLLEDLLEPTFKPQRVDLRVAWEQKTPDEARKHLKDRLSSLKLHDSLEEKECKKGERTYEVTRYEVNRQILTPSELVDIEHHEDERILYERLRATLPEQQFMFCWYRGQGMKYEEIAAEMGIAVNTVKAHARLAKNNPNLRGLLGR